LIKLLGEVSLWRVQSAITYAIQSAITQLCDAMAKNFKSQLTDIRFLRKLKAANGACRTNTKDMHWLKNIICSSISTARSCLAGDFEH